MNISKVDLNLLVYLDVLLREQNVTRAAAYLNITQPAMSNGLRRLRALFDDPLLIRTGEGMMPTERAQALAPRVHQIVALAQETLQPRAQFDALNSQQVFRISASDYAESALLPVLLTRLRSIAPHVSLDILTPSDVGFSDVELGKVDLVINRFDTVPQSFLEQTLWEDSFLCLLSTQNPLIDTFDLENYLKAKHVWVSKTGMGVGVGVNPQDVQRLGWVDEELRKAGHKRQISIFTRHYQAAMKLAEQNDLVVTLPARAAKLQAKNKRLVIKSPPFEIAPIELKMAWSPLVEHSPAHRWLREVITEAANDVN